MDGGTLYSIGELARRTGLTVKAIRFYSDRGIVPPTDRNPAGYRLYGIDAVARLELVRTLRELGVDLPTIRKVVERELSLPEVAAAHAEALGVQIRTLRLRRCGADGGGQARVDPEEMDLMHKLAKLSEDERRRLIGDFLDAVFGGLDAGAEFAGIMRSMTPELPDNPEAEQVRGVGGVGRAVPGPGISRRHAAAGRGHAADAPGATPDTCAATSPQWSVTRPGRPWRPASTRPRPRPIRSSRRSRRSSARLRPPRRPRPSAPAADPAGERERPSPGAVPRLLAVINGWPAPESLAPVFDWFIQALRARMPDRHRPPPRSRSGAPAHVQAAGRSSSITREGVPGGTSTRSPPVGMIPRGLRQT